MFSRGGSSLMTRRASISLVTFHAIVLLSVVSCQSEVQLVAPPPPDSASTDPNDNDSTGTDSTNVQRATLVVAATINLGFPGAAAVVADLGLASSTLAGAAVEVRRWQSTDVFTATLDSNGQTQLTGLLTGTYDVSVLRLLTPDERARLRPELQDVTGFAAGSTVRLRAPQRSVMLSTIVGRRGSLVISEVFDHAPPVDGRGYVGAMYLELYNNADTTIYLDGKLVGWGPIWGWDFQIATCSLTQQWQTDPDGLWSPQLMRLPGSGTQYPLAPGRTAVIATDGIDHSAVDPRLPNLSAAAFETIGSTDVDNPSVPNATIIVNEFDLFGRGIMFIAGLSNIYFVADTVDLSTVPWMRPNFPNVDLQWPRVPTDRILDVYTTRATAKQTATIGGDNFCERQINEVFDIQSGRLNDGNGFYSKIRRSLGVFDGRAMLQRTKTSALDFVRSRTLTPGRVP